MTLLVKLIFSAFLVAGFATSSFCYSLPSSQEKPLNDENTQALQRISKGVSAVANHAEKAVVFVSVYKTAKGLPPGMIDPFEFFFGPQGPQGRGGGRRDGQPREQRREEGLGSGFIIDLSNGYIMTNNHVIDDAEEIQLKLANGETYEAKIVGRDPNTDVAIVQISDKKFNRTGLSQLVLGNSDESSIGDLVVAVGAPYGLQASVSFGIVSAMGRGNLQITAMGNFIQTDAAINPGNSGGPLLNVSGQVVGMNTAIYSRTGGYNGIGFAVPSNLARRIGEQLIQTGKVVRGYLGIGMQPIDSELHKSLKLPKEASGALVARVVEGGPADKAGLEPGDVITSINKQNMKNDTDITSTVGLMAPGTKADLGIFRNGKASTLSARIGEFPTDDQTANIKEKGSSGAFGLTLQKLTPFLKDKYNLESKAGLVVTGVQDSSEAARVGVQEGDLLLQVNGKPVTELNQFKSLVASSGPRALIRLERAGQYSFVPLRKK
jgi:serine protease Do